MRRPQMLLRLGETVLINSHSFMVDSVIVRTHCGLPDHMRVTSACRFIHPKGM
jgi:hypothetical protein